MDSRIPEVGSLRGRRGGGSGGGAKCSQRSSQSGDCGGLRLAALSPVVLPNRGWAGGTSETEAWGAVVSGAVWRMARGRASQMPCLALAVGTQAWAWVRGSNSLDPACLAPPN